MAELDFFLDLPDEDDAVTKPAPFGPRAAVDTLPLLVLAEALSSPERKRGATLSSLALVIHAPSGAWVEPLREACESRVRWSAVFARSGSSRIDDRLDKGNAKVSEVLARGGRVLGISHAAERYLPSALLGAADMQLRIEGPSNLAVSRAIRAATGQRPGPMPAHIAAGLDFHEISAAIRLGSSAASCVDRLATASKAKAVVDPLVAEAPPFAELRGFGAAHDWCARLIADLESWRSGQLPFEAIDKNCVWCSAPGLGKTTLVRSLAQAARLPLVASSVASWFINSNGYLDGVIKQIDETFLRARTLSPSILFLDEIEAVPNRETLSDRAKEWWGPLVAHLLLLLETSASSHAARVCVIGATNFGDRLDPALVRPGRLNKVIEIGYPTAADLAEIFRQRLDGDLAGLDLRPIGQLAAGSTGAQVVDWVRQARALARRQGRPLRSEDLIAVIAPPDTRSPTAMWRSALHEAAHCVATEILRVGHVKDVTLVARNGGGGSTHSTPALDMPPTRGALELTVVALLAGRAAEIVLLGDASAGAGGSPQSDLAKATMLLAAMHGSLGLGARLSYRGAAEKMDGELRFDPVLRDAVEAHLVDLQAQAERFVAQQRPVIERLADRLLAARVLGGDEVRASIFAGSEARPEVR